MFSYVYALRSEALSPLSVLSDWSMSAVDVMGHYRYNEKILEHQRADDVSAGEPDIADCVFPSGFKAEMFESEQLEYLNDVFREYRNLTMRKTLELLTVQADGWQERAAVLDKMINRPELRWREAPAFYGLSNHRFFDAKNMLEVVFAGYGEHILKLLQVRKARNLTRKKNSAPPSSCHEVEG